MTTKQRIFPAMLAFAAGLMAGCATKQQAYYSYTGEEVAENKDDEYVYFQVTGSHIIKRVKKADVLAGRVPKDSTLVIMTPEEFAQMIRPGRRF
jgi:hypothetical protein